MAVADGREMAFEATELRLGLPGSGGGEGAKNSSGKRGFSEMIDLKLQLETKRTVENNNLKANAVKSEEMKRVASQKSLVLKGEEMKMVASQKSLVLPVSNDPEKPSAPKAQVVGWPPVRSFRKNIMTVQSEKGKKEDSSNPAAFVKVSLDGAPYLRKVDLKMYSSYQELYMALEKMFSSFTIGNCGSGGMNGRDFMNESKLMDLLNGSEYVPTYEDKDGDWMLVGDVPWEMFVSSCKRLRIMKGSEAVGLAPRAMEKCKSRS